MSFVYDQYRFNVEPGPYYEPSTALPAEPPSTYPVRYIAYYLPQFHAIPENDRWWGAGFTEWTNVTKALPRFVGHYQPRLPADLGFYDLRSVEVLERQAELARRGGIYGFCIHNYWFSGYRILDTPLKLLLENSSIRLPFCINWANENWSRRWDGSEQEILLEQRYDNGDDLRYAETLIPAFEDDRYIRIAGRPLLMVYRPKIIPDVTRVVERWRDFFLRRGLGDPFIVMAQTYGSVDPRPFGMDGAAGFPPHNGCFDDNRRRWHRFIDRKFSGGIFDYDTMAQKMLAQHSGEYPSFPTVAPQWDNEARRPGRGVTFVGSTPAKYGNWLRLATRQAVGARSEDQRIVFINAWNEWAEGAYLEPDRHYGYAYLAETARVFGEQLENATPAAKSRARASLQNLRFEPHGSFSNVCRNAAYAVPRRLRQLVRRSGEGGSKP